MNGEAATIWSIVLLTVAGAAVVLGAVQARKRGLISSSGAKIAAVVAILIIAAILWIGPALFIVAD